MAKTFTDFRAEKGLYLKDVAEKTGIPEDELRAVEQSGTIPPEIAKILINDYQLPGTYFTAESFDKLTPQNPAKYFLKVTIIYYLLSALASNVPMFISYFGFLFRLFNPAFDGNSVSNSPVSTLLTSLWTIAVSFFSCIIFANHILKRTTFTGDIKKYQFLHHSIPSGALAFISMLTAFITTFSFDKESGINATYWLWQGVNLFISLIGIVLVVIIHTQILKTAIEEDNIKKQKSFKNFAIIITISSALAFALTVISQILLQDFRIFIIVRRIFVYGLYIATAWAVAFTNPNDEKKCKLAYTILPISTIFCGFVFTVIGLIV